MVTVGCAEWPLSHIPGVVVCASWMYTSPHHQGTPLHRCAHPSCLVWEDSTLRIVVSLNHGRGQHSAHRCASHHGRTGTLRIVVPLTMGGRAPLCAACLLHTREDGHLSAQHAPHTREDGHLSVQHASLTHTGRQVPLCAACPFSHPRETGTSLRSMPTTLRETGTSLRRVLLSPKVGREACTRGIFFLRWVGRHVHRVGIPPW